MAVALADVVGTLRIRTSRDEPALRSAVSGAVARAQLHPPGRSPRSVLVVRHLDHRLTWEAGSVPAPAGSAVPGLVGDIDALWRIAARPAAGRVPATAPAVAFADLVELLAHFCEDVAGGIARERWWWDVMARTLAPAGRVADALQRHATIAPAVVAELDRRGTTAAVLDAVTQREAADLTAAVALTHGAPRVAERVRCAFERDPGDHHRPDVAPSATDALADAPDRTSRPDARHLFASVARLAATGDPRLRSMAYADLVARGLGTDLDAAASAAWPTGADDAAPAVAADAPRARRRAARRDIAGEVAAEPRRRRPADGRESEAWPWAGGDESEGVTALDPPPPAVAGPDRRPKRSTGRPGFTDAGQVRSDVDGDVGVGDRAVADTAPTGVVTGLGGVFFLVDVVRQLDLPDVFEPGWHLASRLGGWATLEVLARSLVPATPPWPYDPIWRVLADLGGGTGALAPERALPARVDRRLPPAWQELRLPHVEAPSPRGSLAAGATQGLRRWLGLARPFVVDLLVDRVGVDADDLLDAVLVRPARIDVDRTHVDVVLPLASATVPVRRAGLDRDPGWVPQLGRVVLFHFETEVVGL